MKISRRRFAAISAGLVILVVIGLGVRGAWPLKPLLEHIQGLVFAPAHEELRGLPAAFALLRPYLAWAVHTADTYQGAIAAVSTVIAAVSTVFVAFFTATLWWTSRGQLKAIKGQLKAMQDQSEVSLGQLTAMEGQLKAMQDQSAAMKEQTGLLRSQDSRDRMKNILPRS